MDKKIVNFTVSQFNHFYLLTGEGRLYEAEMVQTGMDKALTVVQEITVDFGVFE